MSFRCARTRCLLVVCRLVSPVRQQTRSQHDLVCPGPGYLELVEQALGNELGGERIRRLAVQALPRVVVGVGAHGVRVKGREGLEARSLGQNLTKLDAVLLAAALLSRLLRVIIARPAARRRWRGSFSRRLRSCRARFSGRLESRQSNIRLRDYGSRTGTHRRRSWVCSALSGTDRCRQSSSSSLCVWLQPCPISRFRSFSVFHCFNSVHRKLEYRAMSNSTLQGIA